MRSFAQFERKVLHTGIGYESLPFRSEELGRDQLALLELQRSGRLRAWFEERVLSEEAVAAGVRDGSLVIDDRLAEFMRRALAGRADRPESEAARKLVAAALGTGSGSRGGSADH